MATLVPSSTPSRQPFGLLNDTKLRNLQSIKNRQNALTPSSAPSLKRRAPSPSLSDSENVDPNILDNIGKRKRTAHDDDVSLSKPSRYSLHIVPPTKPTISSPIPTPRLDAVSKPVKTPLSAPAAAGRSPTKGRRMGLMQPRKRFAPPSFGTKSPSLSITAALNGTLAHKKAKKLRTIEETKPKSWFFDIFEETDEQQDYRMNEWTMTQSATILDISDDEAKAQEKSDKGKENVDPNEIYSAPTTRSASTARASSVPKVSRKDAMLDEPRTPLGDLNPSEYYGEGLDATSVVLVHEDTQPQPEEQAFTEQQNTEDVSGSKDFTFEITNNINTAITAEVDDIHSLLAASAPVWEQTEQEPPTLAIDVSFDQHNDAFPQGTTNDDPIDIWESASAQDENEENYNVENNNEGFKSDFKFDEGQVFALQEL